VRTNEAAIGGDQPGADRPESPPDIERLEREPECLVGALAHGDPRAQRSSELVREIVGAMGAQRHTRRESRVAGPHLERAEARVPSMQASAHRRVDAVSKPIDARPEIVFRATTISAAADGVAARRSATKSGS